MVAKSASWFLKGLSDSLVQFAKFKKYLIYFVWRFKVCCVVQGQSYACVEVIAPSDQVNSLCKYHLIIFVIVLTYAFS